MGFNLSKGIISNCCAVGSVSKNRNIKCPWQAAPLLCASMIGYRTVRLAQITDGQIIGLFGFGASAHIVIQIIKYKFPNSSVFVFTKTAEHAQLAKRLGAAWTGLSGDKPPEKLNKAMDFTLVGECIRDALAVLDKGGRLVINAIRKETMVPPLDYANSRVFLDEGELIWYK